MVKLYEKGHLRSAGRDYLAFERAWTEANYENEIGPAKPAETPIVLPGTVAPSALEQYIASTNLPTKVH